MIFVGAKVNDQGDRFDTFSYRFGDVVCEAMVDGVMDIHVSGLQA